MAGGSQCSGTSAYRGRELPNGHRSYIDRNEMSVRQSRMRVIRPLPTDTCLIRREVVSDVDTPPQKVNVKAMQTPCEIRRVPLTVLAGT